MPHKGARWILKPCRLGGPHRFRARHRITSGSQVGKVAKQPLSPRGSPPLQSGGAESEVAHKWAGWLHNPCRLGGSPPLQSGGQNQRWPTSGKGGFISPAAWGVPTASERGAESEVAHKWARWLNNPYRLGGPHRFTSGGAQSEVAHKWARWLHNPCRLGGPHRFRARGRIRSAPQRGKVDT